tara:strand:+ start:864 stop:1610 length:747 start_codon:yes stop_codon:yes gene_type:complete
MPQHSPYLFYSNMNGTWTGRYNPSEIHERTSNHCHKGYGMTLIDSVEVTGTTTQAVAFTSLFNDPVKDFRRYGLLQLVARCQNSDALYGQVYYHYSWDRWNAAYNAGYSSKTTVPTAIATAWVGRNGASDYNYPKYDDWSYGGFWAGYMGSSNQGNVGADTTPENWGMSNAWFSSPQANRQGGQVMWNTCTQLSDDSTSGYLANFVGSGWTTSKIDCIVAQAEQMNSAVVWTAGTTFELYGYQKNLVS